MIDGLVIDSFAGGGGASVGIERAIGRPVDVALNHDAEACAMYRANHPHTNVLCQSVYRADPRDVVREASLRRGSRRPLPVDLAWFSPDCTDHSKAKGAAPIRNTHSRDLAWVVVHWAELARPRVILMENVEEWLGWGPLRHRCGADGTPVLDANSNPVLERDPARAGETFRKWCSALRRRAYELEWRELRASVYGTPTIRKRLFLVARCDGAPIAWPDPTHGPGREQPFRTAAQIIDWSLPCPSIFLTREEGRALGVNRPLVEATMRRIARGVKRYVIDAPEPFIVPAPPADGGAARRARFLREMHRGPHPLITPFVTGLAHGEHALRPGSRCHGVDEPIRTIHAGGGNHALITPFVAPVTHQGDDRVHRLDEPLRTVTTAHRGEHALVAPFLVPRYGEREGQVPRTHPIDAPGPTVVPTANGHRLVAAFLAQHTAGSHPGRPARSATEPVSTITTRGTQQSVIASHLINLKGSDRRGSAVDVPLPTVCAGGWHVGEVRAFLMKYYGADQDPRLDEPLHTVTTRDRFGLVMVAGQPYAIVDIGMRMLTAPELFRAQGFPEGYVITPVVDGKPLTKTAQVRMCGNAVNPQLSEALVRANFGIAEPEAEAA